VDKDLLDHLRRLLQAVSEEDVHVEPDENLFKVGLLDSMLLIRLVEQIERDFHITVSDREMSPDYFLSLDRIRLFVQHKLAEAQEGR
jgi:acyl carrier protein